MPFWRPVGLLSQAHPGLFRQFQAEVQLRRKLIPRTSVNKGKGGEGRGHSTIALQVLPVGAGVRFLRLALTLAAHAQAASATHPTESVEAPLIAHKGLQTNERIASASEEEHDNEVQRLSCVPFEQKQSTLFVPVGGRQKPLMSQLPLQHSLGSAQGPLPLDIHETAHPPRTHSCPSSQRLKHSPQ
jgi:hypothetical protein